MTASRSPGHGPQLEADLPKDDQGRYTLEAKLNRDATWTALGTRASAKWQFDSAPTDEQTALDLSYVKFKAGGVENGYADRADAQDITLDFEAQSGATPRDCAKLSFEVS